MCENDYHPSNPLVWDFASAPDLHPMKAIVNVNKPGTAPQNAGNSEESSSLNVIYDMHLPNHTYRAFKFAWVGLPLYPPNIAVKPLDEHTTLVYASWNGATEVTAWQVLVGPTPHTLAVAVSSTPRTGFETVIPVHSPGLYFQVKALNSVGNVIGWSNLACVSCYK